MLARTSFSVTLLAGGLGFAHGAILLSNWVTSNADTAVMSFQTPMIRLIRFTTPNYATNLTGLTTRLAIDTTIPPPVCEIRINTSANAGTVVHTMTNPTFIHGGVRTYTFSTSGFTFQPSTAYAITIRGTTPDQAGAWYRADTLPTPIGLATWINTRRTYDGSAWGVDALVPRFIIDVADPTQSVTGTLNLSDTVGSFAVSRTMTYEIKQGTATVQTGTVVSSASSTPFNISLPANITGGVSISFDGSSFIRESHGTSLTGTTTNVGNYSLFNGDPDHSGEVDAADIDLVIGDFGMMNSADTDVDVSGEVDAADIDIVISNFGASDE